MLTYLAVGLVVCVLLVIFAVSAWREFRTERAIKKQMDKMRELGYAAGLAGLPPDFYRERLGDKLDVADELAIAQGWDGGWAEFQTKPESERAMAAGVARARGSQL